MKARKNKKRIDTKYQMPREEESTVKEDINFNDFSFDSWLIQEMYPEAGSMPTGQDYKAAGKREDDLPEEVPEDDARERANKDTDSSMEEGRCAAEMPSEDAEEEIMTHHPDNAFEAGYAAAVEEIMASIEGLLGDPIEMAQSDRKWIWSNFQIMQWKSTRKRSPTFPILTAMAIEKNLFQKQQKIRKL